MFRHLFFWGTLQYGKLLLFNTTLLSYYGAHLREAVCSSSPPLCAIRRPPIDSETPIVQIRKPQIRIVVEETLGNSRAMVKKKDKDMTDQEMGMMYLKAAHSVRISTSTSGPLQVGSHGPVAQQLPPKERVAGWRVGQVAVHRGQTRASVLSNRLRNYMYPRNTDLPSQVAKTDAKGFKIFADTLEVIEVI